MSDTSDFYAANKQALKSALSSGFVTDGEGNIVTGSQGAPVTTEVDKEAEFRERQLNQAKHILAALVSKHPHDASLRDALGAVESDLGSRNFTATAVAQAYKQVATEQKTAEVEESTELTKEASKSTMEKLTQAAKNAVDSILPAAMIAEESQYSLLSDKPYVFKDTFGDDYRKKHGMPEYEADEPFLATTMPKRPKLGEKITSFFNPDGAELPIIGQDGKPHKKVHFGQNHKDDSPYSLANPSVELHPQDKDLRRKMRDMRDELRSKGIDIDTPSGKTSHSVSGGHHVSSTEHVSPTLVHNAAIPKKEHSLRVAGAAHY